jgi:peptide deformylase
MIKSLLPEGHELLEQETIPFSFWSPPINPIEFRDELIENMKYYDGVGLAANQLGYRYSVFAMNHEGNSMTVYNPQIIEESEENVWETEGCLTYPGLYIKISRPKSLWPLGKMLKVKTFQVIFLIYLLVSFYMKWII